MSAPSPPKPASYVSDLGYDYPENNIANMTLSRQRCQRYCDKTPECAGIVVSSLGDSICWIKSSMGERIPNEHVNTYIKSTPNVGSEAAQTTTADIIATYNLLHVHPEPTLLLSDTDAPLTLPVDYLRNAAPDSINILQSNSTLPTAANSTEGSSTSRQTMVLASSIAGAGILFFALLFFRFYKSKISDYRVDSKSFHSSQPSNSFVLQTTDSRSDISSQFAFKSVFEHNYLKGRTDSLTSSTGTDYLDQTLCEPFSSLKTDNRRTLDTKLKPPQIPALSFDYGYLTKNKPLQYSVSNDTMTTKYTSVYDDRSTLDSAVLMDQMTDDEIESTIKYLSIATSKDSSQASHYTHDTELDDSHFVNIGNFRYI